MKTVNAEIIQSVENFCKMITKQKIEHLIKVGLGCETNQKNATATFRIGKKYIAIDTGGSALYMIEIETGEIFGVKAYNVINKKHSYGTLSTVNNYNWGGYGVVWADGKISL